MSVTKAADQFDMQKIYKKVCDFATYNAIEFEDALDIFKISMLGVNLIDIADSLEQVVDHLQDNGTELENIRKAIDRLPSE